MSMIIIIPYSQKSQTICKDLPSQEKDEENPKGLFVVDEYTPCVSLFSARDCEKGSFV